MAVHSDDDVRNSFKAAAACTLMVLWMSNGKLERRLLTAEAVFINDGSIADVVERCALTLAMRICQQFVSRASVAQRNI